MADRGGGAAPWEHGEAYERYVGRWSRLVARDFIDWLALPERGRWLDVGCGTGELGRTVLERAAPAEVVGIDLSEGFLARARELAPDERLRFEAGDAQAPPFPDGAFDAVVSGLVLNFVPDKDRAVREMRRVVRPGGTAAVYVWDYAGDMQFMRRFWDAATALDPAAAELDEGRRSPICKPEPLVQLFRSAGFESVEARPIDVPTVFRDFDDFWSPFLGGQGPAPGYCVSLTAEHRNRLRERLRATLPLEADGSVRLFARAWAVRGTAPNEA